MREIERWSCLLRCALAALLAAVVLPAAEFRVERIFGPETPTGPYKHPASITELANGDLYLVYYGGGGEYAIDTAVYGARLPKGSKQWTKPRVIAKDPFRSAGNGVIWTAPDGVVWLFYVVRFGKAWSDSRIQVKISTWCARNRATAGAPGVPGSSRVFPTRTPPWTSSSSPAAACCWFRTTA